MSLVSSCVSNPAVYVFPHASIFVSQVMDLGVTRMLVHRLVRVFPYLCKGKKPPAGSGTATWRAAFKRLLRLG